MTLDTIQSLNNETRINFIEIVKGTTPATPTPTMPPINGLKINFQNALADIPAGYEPDNGDLWGLRANGYSYGWSVSHTDTARDRNNNDDQRLDTIIQFHTGSKWELFVPNGEYTVTVGVGDASFASTYTINVENINYFLETAIPANQFYTETKVVTVADNRLTIDAGASGEKQTRICYIELVSGALTPSPTPTPFNVIKVNFQADGNKYQPDGYLLDSGKAYNLKANGYTYGWIPSHMGYGRVYLVTIF